MATYLSRFCLRSLLEKEEEKKETKKKKIQRTMECHTKEKSYRSRGGFNLWCLWSGDRGIGDRGDVRGLGLFNGDSGSGSSFGGRHYNNRDKWELQKQPVSKE